MAAETRAPAAPASPATPIATTAPPARSRAGEPWQSHRCPAPRSRPIQVTGWYRFGGSPKTRSIASASTSTNSLEISGFRTTGTRSRYLSAESHAQPRANGKVGAGRAPRDLGGHVEDNSRENEELDAGVEADDVPRVALRRRGVEELAVHRPPVSDLAAERGGHRLLEQEGGPLRLAQPGQSHVRIEAQLPRQIEGRERRAPEIDPLRADRRARRRQLDERQDAERGPPAAFRRVEKPILDGECEIAEADVGVGVLQPDQRVHVEPGLEPARDSRSQEDVDQELLLVLTVAQSGPRVLDPALDLQSAGRNRDRAGGETRAVGRDEILLGHRDGRAERQDRAERDKAARPHRLIAGVAPPELLPERRLLPARLREAPPVLVEMRVREEDRDHLLAAPVPEPEPPGRRSARVALGSKKGGARHSADARQLRAGCSAVIVDAQVEVPDAGVDRQVSVEHRHRRACRELDLVGGALDQRSDGELVPVLREELGEQALDPVSLDGHVAILGRDAVQTALDRRHALLRHATADRRPPAASPSGTAASGPRGRAGARDSAPPRRRPRRAPSATTSRRPRPS